MTTRFGTVIACSALILGAVAAPTYGQRVTVQLPTFRQFSMATTVVVPDRGGVYLGGVNQARRQASSFGAPLFPGGHRTRGGTLSNAGVSVHAWIHDFEAMDQEVLSQARAAKENRPRPREGFRKDLPEPPDPPPLTIGELRAARRAADLAKERQAVAYLQAGQRAQEQGKPGVAKIYYRMALRRASGDLHDAIANRLAALSSGRSVGNVARR